MAKRTRRGSAAIVVRDHAGITPVVEARRKLDLKPASAAPISILSQKLFGGKSSFMEFARLAVHIEPGLAHVVEDYESLDDRLRAAVSIDEICVKHEIDPLHLIGVVAEAAKKYGQNTAILIASLSFPDVINRSVKRALTPDGFKDRELLAKHHGFIPTPHGPTISVNTSSSAAARADSTAGEGKGLPSFERTMRESDDIIRERE